ncbi:MAG: endonuclease/exonuclease/phosphatase family protein [Propionibacteriaceae bacterium]|nr:endonuclease/exonuclease/phosphatase family protein [Propionibacteriaceae bacterium]
MRVVTFNINGIRAAMRRGFRDWLDDSDADVIALQEVRCRVPDLPPDAFGAYNLAYDPGQLAGRNGVAILTRQHVPSFTWTDDNPFAQEGRLIGVHLEDAPLDVISVYVPKGGVPLEVAPEDGGREGYTPAQQQARYERKADFLRRFTAEIDARQADAEAHGRHLLVLGDFNIAHGPADITNWRSNLTHEGFLPGERAWLDAQIGQAPSHHRLAGRTMLAPSLDWQPSSRPLVDVVRSQNKDGDGPYSWWSWMGQAFAKDVGWRIDYHLASAGLAATARQSWVDRAASADRRISDHAPVVVDYT